MALGKRRRERQLEAFVAATELGMRASIPERASPKQRRWTDKDPEAKRVVYATRRRTQSRRGKEPSRLRSELTERSFADVCDTGGARRTWLRGLASVTKLHLAIVAARNLSTIMRVLCGIGSPRALQGLRALLQRNWTDFERLISELRRLVAALIGNGTERSRSFGGCRSAGQGHRKALGPRAAKLQQRTRGTVFDTITTDTFNTLECIFPTSRTTAAFEHRVEPLLSQIRANLYQARIVSTMRDVMLPKMLKSELLISQPT